MEKLKDSPAIEMIETYVKAGRLYLADPISQGRVLVWPRVDMNERHTIEKESGNRISLRNLQGYYSDDDNGEWYLFASVDCFDPPMFAIQADSWETAYEIFLDEFADEVDISDADYNTAEKVDAACDNGEITCSPNGRLVHAESIQGWSTKPVRS